MTKSSPVIRPASVEDVTSYYGGPPPRTMRGFAIALGDDILAVFGVYRDNGHTVAFSAMKDEMRKYKKTIVKACRILTDYLDKIGGNAYAVANKNEPTATYLLVKLGFKPTGQFGPEGEVMLRS